MKGRALDLLSWLAADSAVARVQRELVASDRKPLTPAQSDRLRIALHDTAEKTIRKILKED